MPLHRHPTPIARIGAGLSVVLSVVIAVAMVALIPTAPARAAGVIYVRPGGAGSKDGLSWANAKDLAQALADATSGDELWVAKGTYKPTTSDEDLRLATFQLKPGLLIYGGFAGNESTPEARNWTTNVVILSGERGIAGNADNCYHVVTGASGATLDGVTISGGNADGDGASDPSGGGIYNLDSSPTLANLTISGNEAIYGGGMYNLNSSPLLTNVTFSANYAPEGAGMYNQLSHPTLTNVTFSANIAQTSPGEALGAGMYNWDSSPLLTNVTFSANQSSALGGGMYNTTSDPEITSSPTLSNVIFSGNSAVGGAGMANRYGGAQNAPILTNVIFRSNSATDGGGIFTMNAAPILYNVLLSGNNATGMGGGMFNSDNAITTLRHVTISGNSAASGGGIYNDVETNSDFAQITSSIIWGNTAATGRGIYHPHLVSYALPLIDHSLVQDSSVSGSWNTASGVNGGGNLDIDPQFVLPVPSAPSTGGNLRLREGSPAINAGLNTGIVDTDTDLDGQSRIVNTTVDMGAYERQPAGVRYVNYAASGSGSGYSWANAITSLPEALAFAGSGDELWVAQGSYTPGTSRSDTFQLRAGAAVYGGFAATESTRDARNWTTNVVTLSGDIGTLGSTSDNVYHVVTGAAGATLDGVTISQGNANLAPDDKGGGIYNAASNLSLANLIISSNSAAYGGGMYNTGSATLSSVSFSSNSASGDGGGMYNASSDPSLTNVSFSGNSAASGGGVYNANSDPSLTSVTFTTNSATNGGGIYNDHSSPTLTSVTLSGNNASVSGGGIYDDNSEPTLSSVILSGNSAGSGGGGMYNSSSSPTLKNVVISGNKATAGSGGGMHNSSSSPTLRHVSISGNSAGGSGGGMYNKACNPDIGNSIIWGNLASSNPAISNSGSIPFIRNSLVQGSGGNSAWDSTFGTNLGNNLDTDPLFTTAVPTAPSTGGNLRLQATSPAINAGLNTLLPMGLTSDLAGSPRIIGGTVDMGAYEVQNPALLSITRAGTANPTNASSVSFKLTFTMPVSGLDAADLVLTTSGGQSGATLGALSSSGATWTVVVNTVDDQLGTIRLDLLGSNGIVSSDAPEMAISGPGSSGFSSGEVYTLDRVRPETTITGNTPASPNKNTSASFSFSGSDTSAVTFECQIDGGGFSACTSPHLLDGLSHASHTFQVRAIDSVGNVDASPDSYTWTVDTVPPTVSISAPSRSVTNNVAVTFTVSYSDDQMGAISLNTSDITLNTTGTATGTLGVSGSGSSTRTVTVSAISGDGTFSISLAASTATDAAGNSALASADNSASVTVDNTRPTVTMSSVVSDPTNVSSIPVTIVFSENVTDFSQDDMTLGNASISKDSFSGSGKHYSFTLTPLGNGEVTAAIGAGAGMDTADNPNIAATTFSRIYDDSPLAMSISSTTSLYTNASPILVNVHFGKPVDPSKADFTLADLSITPEGSASIGNFSGSGTSYSFEITPIVEGEPITVQVVDKAAKDAAGNPSSAHSITRTYDIDAPSGLSLVASDPPTQDTISYDFIVVFSDNLGLDLTSLGDGDVTVTTPGGKTIIASYVSRSEQPDQTVLATFRIAAPGGTWESFDNGDYVVKLAAASVHDMAGNVAAANDLGSFTVALECKIFVPSVIRP